MTTYIKFVGSIKTPSTMTEAQAERLVEWLNDKVLEDCPVEVDWAHLVVDEVEVE